MTAASCRLGVIKRPASQTNVDNSDRIAKICDIVANESDKIANPSWFLEGHESTYKGNPMKFAYLSAEDAQRLSADLRSVEAGITRSLSLDTAPILEAHQMYSRRTACLSGYVFGHPSLGDGREIMTSQLMYMDTEVGIARTLNRWYRLGHPAGIERA